MRQLETVRLANVLVAILMAVVPFHAFLTVWASTLVGHFTLLRLWDEALLLILSCLVGALLVRDKALRATFFNSRLTRLVGLYALVMLLLGVISLSKGEVGVKATAYSFVINLRFLVWLLAVWVVALHSDWLLRHWRRIVFVPLAVTVAFGLLQFFVLPHNFLKHFGYNDTVSYVATVTLNQDSSTIRVQSFLRGANPFGAYLMALLPLVLVCVGRWRRSWRYWLLAGASAAALFLTFSRSAWLGTAVALVLLGWFVLARYRRVYLYVLAALVAVTMGGLFLLRGSGGVQNALLHKSQHSTASVTSNQGHESALRSSLRDLTTQPFGDGPGTAGQPGVYNTGHPSRNTESYWLEIALEMGWPGLLLFGTIVGVVGYELFRRFEYRLAVGLFVTLCGLVVVNFFAYGWTDDTLAYVWWGLVGVSLGLPPAVKARESSKNRSEKAS